LGAATTTERVTLPVPAGTVWRIAAAHTIREARETARRSEVVMDIYPWVILLHIIGAFVFAASHGVAIWMAMVLSRERDRTRMSALLDLSSASLGGVYLGLVLLLVGGIWGGLIGNWFGSLWIWIALVLLVAVAVIMYIVATPYFRSLRDAVGIKSPYGPKDAPDPVPLPDAELVALAARVIPSGARRARRSSTTSWRSQR
jgi:MFS family permease